MGCKSTTGIPSDDNFEIQRNKFLLKEKEILSLIPKSEVKINTNQNPEHARKGIENLNKLKNCVPELEKEYNLLLDVYKEQEASDKLGPSRFLKSKELEKCKLSYEKVIDQANTMINQKTDDAFAGLGKL